MVCFIEFHSKSSPRLQGSLRTKIFMYVSGAYALVWPWC